MGTGKIYKYFGECITTLNGEFTPSQKIFFQVILEASSEKNTPKYLNFSLPLKILYLPYYVKILIYVLGNNRSIYFDSQTRDSFLSIVR